jgi:DNA repair ATPase RecN
MDDKTFINHIIDIKGSLGGVHERMSSQDRILNEQTTDIKDIKFETKKTNGRVNKLEDRLEQIIKTQEIYANTVEKLAEVSSQNSGLIKAVQEDVKDKYADTAREINELKKDKMDNVEITKTKIGRTGVVVVATIGLVSAILTGLLTLIVNR